MAKKWAEIKRKHMSPAEMRDRAVGLRGDKDNMSPGERDLASEQWKMTAQLAERMDRLRRQAAPVDRSTNEMSAYEWALVVFCVAGMGVGLTMLFL